MLNHITIMGRLVKDPELRRTQSGVAVCSFTVAVDRDFQSREAAEKQTDSTLLRGARPLNLSANISPRAE